MNHINCIGPRWSEDYPWNDEFVPMIVTCSPHSWTNDLIMQSLGGSYQHDKRLFSTLCSHLLLLDVTCGAVSTKSKYPPDFFEILLSIHIPSTFSRDSWTPYDATVAAESTPKDLHPPRLVSRTKTASEFFA